MIAKEQSHRIFQTLKRVLKGQQVTYGMLAKKLHLSEAAIKRIFAQESCSLDRLTEICEAVDISIFDLVSAARNTQVEEYSLGGEAESFFEKNLNYFRFYRKLSHHKTLNTFRCEDRLDEASIRKYLKKLQQLGLIEVLEKDKIIFKHKGYLKVDEDSGLYRRFFKEFTPEFFSKILSSGSKDHHFLHFSTGLMPINLNQLIQDLHQLRKKYREQGYIDQHLSKTDAESVSVVIGVGPYRIGATDLIPRI
jgi:DNA-binding Xre family transcriptional regulator